VSNCWQLIDNGFASFDVILKGIMLKFVGLAVENKCTLSCIFIERSNKECGYSYPVCQDRS
jgi:hypothetical protein